MQTAGATSKQNETQLIIPHIIKISYPFSNLKQEKYVKPSSSVAPLSPFTNSAGLLHVGGRLKTANFNFETPPDSQITNH